jgi:hypothetical protein
MSQSLNLSEAPNSDKEEQMVFESLTSTDPGELYRALHVCSNESRRELSLGRERGAYLGAMSLPTMPTDS